MSPELLKNHEILICGGKFGAAITLTLARVNPEKQIIFGVRDPKKVQTMLCDNSLKFFFQKEISNAQNPDETKAKLSLPNNVHILSLEDLKKITEKLENYLSLLSLLNL